MQINKHSIRLGGDFNRWRQDSYAVNATNQGQFSFTGLLSGNAFADFLLGLPNSTTKTDYLGEISLASEARFRVCSGRLACPFGFDLESWPALRICRIVYRLAGKRPQLRLENAIAFPDPGKTAPLNDATQRFCTSRIGFAYNFKKTGTVVRGGYGIFFTQPTTANVTLLYRNPPRNSSNTYNTDLNSPNLTLGERFSLHAACDGRSGSRKPRDVSR